MKKYILITIIVVLAVLITKPAAAQLETHWELQWNISIPASDFKDYIERASQTLKLTEKQVLDVMRFWYNGYKFAKQGTTVYNPFSILLFLWIG